MPAKERRATGGGGERVGGQGRKREREGEVARWQTKSTEAEAPGSAPGLDREKRLPIFREDRSETRREVDAGSTSLRDVSPDLSPFPVLHSHSNFEVSALANFTERSMDICRYQRNTADLLTIGLSMGLLAKIVVVVQ